MKGEETLTLLFSVLILILVVSLLYGLLTGKINPESTSHKKTTTFLDECSSNDDCINSKNGRYCMKINGGYYKCSCIVDSDCDIGGKCNENNRCKY